MKIDEIIDMKNFIEELKHSDGCHLYLWTTNKYLKDAFDVIDAWGFEYITTITWMKKNFGLGQYYRGLTEHCLFCATPQRLPYKTLENGKRAQGLTGFIEQKREHSRKPDQMREWIEIVSYAPRIELFARESFNGWDVWGNEAQNESVKMRLKDY